MISEFKKHKTHYLVLFIILILGTCLIIHFRFNSPTKLLFLVLTALFYFLWGIWHHQTADHLRLEVMLEYFLVSLLAVLVINSLI